MLWHYDRVQRLFLKGMAHGATRLGPVSLEWDMSGHCSDRYTRTITGRAATGDKNIVVKPGKRGSLFVTIHTPCRKCERCKKARASLWRYRVHQEIKRSQRTWFGTLTLRPAVHVHVLNTARVKAKSRSVDWETLDPAERQRRTLGTALSEVTRFLKRVRKNSGVPLRYIAVTEWHKSGLPHFHVLIHETTDQPCPHRILKEAWVWGFSDFKLVPADNPKQGLYLCKYLTKSAVARVRASQRYGLDPLARS